MSRPITWYVAWFRFVNWFRAFNAFIERTVSVWSLSFLAVPLVLSLIIAGFFASPVIVPLIAICGIVGAIALISGGSTGYHRYGHLTKQTNKLFDKYTLSPWVEKEAPIPKDISSKTIFLVKKNDSDSTYDAHIKWKIEKVGDIILNVDIRLTQTEKEIIEGKTHQIALTEEEKKKEEKRRRVIINDIIEEILSAVLAQAANYPEEQRNITRWENMHAFLSDTPTMFAFSGIIIFLVGHVLFAAANPYALIIAGVISIAYGIFSVLVKNTQVDLKLKTMQALQDEYEAVKNTVDTRIIEVNALAKRADDIVEKNTELGQTSTETVNLLKDKIAILKTTKLVVLQNALAKIHDDTHFKYSSMDINRIVVGGFLFGASTIVLLPFNILMLLGFSVTAIFSMPALWGVVAVVALLYGAFKAYYKWKAIKREKWGNMDEKIMTEVNEALDNSKTNEPKMRSEEEEIKDKLEALEKSLVYEQPPSRIAKTMDIIGEGYSNFFSPPPVELKNFSNYGEKNTTDEEGENSYSL